MRDSWRRTLTVALLLLSMSVLAGCAAPGAEESAVVAPPRLGDVAEYRVSGHFVDFARWASGAPFAAADAAVHLQVGDAEGATDGFGAFHEAYEVKVSVKDGAAVTPRRVLLVDPAHASVVQSRAPISTDQSAIIFDERSYPWAWGMSVLHGEALEEGATFPFTLLPNAGQAEPLQLAFVVEARERVDGRDAWRVAVSGAPGVAWTLWVDPSLPVPVRVHVDLEHAAVLSPFVRLQAAPSEGPVAFRADLADLDRGSGLLPPRDSTAAWLDEPVTATFAPWNREAPPEGTDSLPFRLDEAVMWAKTFDVAFARWFTDNPGSLLSRATYYSEGGVAEGTAKHVWLVQYVSRNDAYYEVQVERTIPEVTALAGGLTQVTSSGSVAAPEGAHGWFQPDALPSDLLTLASGIAIMQAYYPSEGVEVFIRSFTEPVGYGYYLDGGFEKEGGRYTVIVNAQTGFVQAAVGPVSPLTTPITAAATR